MARDKVRRSRQTRVHMPARVQDGRELDDVIEPSTAPGAWPIGSLFLTTVPTNPNSLLGFGAWSLYAAGRVLVGIDAGLEEFNVAGETGGELRHVLTCAEIPDCP